MTITESLTEVAGAMGSACHWLHWSAHDLRWPEAGVPKSRAPACLLGGGHRLVWWARHREVWRWSGPCTREGGGEGPPCFGFGLGRPVLTLLCSTLRRLVFGLTVCDTQILELVTSIILVSETIPLISPPSLLISVFNFD